MEASPRNQPYLALTPILTLTLTPNPNPNPRTGKYPEHHIAILKHHCNAEVAQLRFNASQIQP